MAVIIEFKPINKSVEYHSIQLQLRIRGEKYGMLKVIDMAVTDHGGTMLDARLTGLVRLLGNTQIMN
jgi:hypothetical protein